MTSVGRQTTRARLRWAMMALAFAFAPAAVVQQSTATLFKRLSDGREWTTNNLGQELEGSYCYEDAPANCTRYGRLYTLAAAEHACRTLGAGWRLPTNEEWRQMVKHYGGVLGDSADGGHSAYAALVTGGDSGFDVVFGGRRDPNGEYARLGAHGFYWTAPAGEPGDPWFYNFGGQRFLNRHSDGDEQTALSVRCVRDVAPAQEGDR